MPTSEWNAATSSGIEVIGTRRAITAPMLPPTAMPRMTSSQPTPSAGGCEASVVATAIAMPAMPKKLPCREEAGLDSPRSDRMNSTPATRYSSAARLAFIGDAPWWPSLLLFLVHREHALGDQEAAEDIDAGEYQRDEAETARPAGPAAGQRHADREQRADHDHRRDRVGHRHERRMQGRRDRPDHVIADEDRKHEDREAEHRRIDRAMGRGGDDRGDLIRDGLGGIGGLPGGGRRVLGLLDGLF